MKKVLFVAFIACGVALASCGGSKTESSVDSVAVDTTVVDSLATDSSAVDSVATK
jgi:hypothetical protein